MDLYPRGPKRKRLLLYFLPITLFYLFMWYCTRTFDLPPPGQTEGDLASLQARLTADIEVLAERIGDRNFFAPERLQQAREWVTSRWKEQGLVVKDHQFRCHDHDFQNLEVDVAGPANAPIILVGAHYDSAGTPGADDNGSGVAALLEISRVFKGAALQKRLRCVAFTNEEPPFFDTDDMGSRRYAVMARERGDRIEAMISLETIAYYSEKPGSQRYPAGLGMFYPDRGNFAGVVGDLASRPLVARTAASLARSCDVPIECASLPGWMPGVFWSDHASFWRIGVPAVMITDTAYFRNPHYHRATDKPRTLDFPRLARLTAGILGVVRELCGARAP